LRNARAVELKTPETTKPKGIIVRDDRPESGYGYGSWVETQIEQFRLTSAYGKISGDGDERIFDEPFVGFSSGSDPLYGQLKDEIGPPYMTPREIFERSFPDLAASAHELTVVSLVMPFARQIRLDNRLQTTYPAERWVRAKRAANEFAGRLAEHLGGSLEREGIASVAPRLAPFYTIGRSERYGLTAIWSERHAAYVSGLGTFGLCDGFITERGKAVDCRSIIAKLAIPPTPRPYSDHHAYCLHYARGTCGRCISRCPAEAISEQGHGKERCREHCFGPALSYVKDHYGIDEYGCGLCQTSVPCERRNPMAESREMVALGGHV
jgi:epoxyqueuosine reductase